jgi:cysteinyl-tRNA synthetase, unknown class
MKKFLPHLAFLLIIFIFCSCSSNTGNNTPTIPNPTVNPIASPTGEGSPMSLKEVEFWAIQLQKLETEGAVDTLASSPYDMLVLEPTRTDWANEKTRDFNTAEMVKRLKNSRASDGYHRKLVIAYVNIGEAESWRWYWKWSHDLVDDESLPPDWPSFIIGIDPDGWDGNYPVAYWDSTWKSILITGQGQSSSPYGDYNSTLDEVLKDGFDGIYMDWVSGFNDGDVINRASLDGVDPAKEMINLIREIRSYCRQRNPGFLVIQQNASELHRSQSEIFNLVDAVSQEAVWYDGSAYGDWNAVDAGDIPNDPGVTEKYLNNLSEWQQAGKPVFNIEYAVKYADNAYQKSREKGFIPYCTRRALSQLARHSVN